MPIICTTSPSHVSIGVVPVTCPPPTRGPIERFSGRSKSRLAAYLATCTARYQYMGTLTYGVDFPSWGPDAKRHLDLFLQWLLRRMRRLSGSPADESICWFLEFQKRGAPHFHLFYTRRIPWKEAAQQWARIIGDPGIWRTSTRFEKLNSGRGGTVSYARKYAAKLTQKVVPHGYEGVGRFWGIRGLRARAVATTRWTDCEEGRVRMRRLWDVLIDCEKAGIARRFPWPEPARGVSFYFRREIPSGTAAALARELISIINCPMLRTSQQKGQPEHVDGYEVEFKSA